MPTLLALEQVIRQRQLDAANNSGKAANTLSHSYLALLHCHCS